MKKHVHGGDVYRYSQCVDFSANCNPLGTPQSVKDAVIQCLEHVSDYPQVGYSPLREAIGEYEKVPASFVICGNGAADLIFSLCQAGKPQKALVAAPCFAEYEQALESVGCTVEHFFLTEEEEFAVGEDFLSALTDDLDIVFLCNPNNPTGILLRGELLIKILEKCTEKDIFLVVDECFLDFVAEPEKHTLKAYLENSENLFLLKAFTKRYAMAGIRLGYGLCSNRILLERMTAMTQPWNVSSLAQAAGAAALLETDYVEKGRQTVFAEAIWLKRKMSALGLTVFPSQANYIFFKGSETLFEDAVKKGVLIRDCSNYPGLCKGYYRIAVKLHEENEMLIRAFEEIREERGTI